LPQPTAARSILDRRLVIVTGKGGTGKTSVVAALALAGARSGRRVITVETGRDEAVPRLLAPGVAEVGYEGRTVRPGIRCMRIDPYEALSEYIGLQFGMRGMANLAFRNKAFRQLLDASPGWRELITLGKIWHLQQQTRPDGSPTWDLLLVDAPATGHGITFLDVPRVTVSAVRAGPLRRHSSWVESMIRDAEHTLLLPVALAEELPARETAELVERLREGVGIHVDRVVVNALMPPPTPAGLEDLDARLDRIGPERDLGGLPPAPVLAACVRHARERHELNRRYADEIARTVDLPTVELPYLDHGVEGPDDLEILADALVGPERVAA
jgi:anion-transporting  ArsA/GET3 family ATPase